MGATEVITWPLWRRHTLRFWVRWKSFSLYWGPRWTSYSFNIKGWSRERESLLTRHRQWNNRCWTLLRR
jgi:hypothetical protein